MKDRVRPLGLVFVFIDWARPDFIPPLIHNGAVQLGGALGVVQGRVGFAVVKRNVCGGTGAG
jgi:hypothetical protein